MIQLDKKIVSHLEAMDKIEDAADEDIDKIFKGIDIDDVMNDPQGSMMIVVNKVTKTLEDKHFIDAVKEGSAFGLVIESTKKDLVIPDSNDPNLNLKDADEVFGEDFNQGKQD